MVDSTHSIVHGPALQAGSDTTTKRLQTLAVRVVPVFMKVEATRRPPGAFALDVLRSRIRATRRWACPGGWAREHVKPIPKGEIDPNKWGNYDVCMLLAALRGYSKHWIQNCPERAVRDGFPPHVVIDTRGPLEVTINNLPDVDSDGLEQTLINQVLWDMFNHSNCNVSNWHVTA